MRCQTMTNVPEDHPRAVQRVLVRVNVTGWSNNNVGDEMIVTPHLDPSQNSPSSMLVMTEALPPHENT